MMIQAIYDLNGGVLPGINTPQFFGAKADGITDDSPAIARLLTAYKGKSVYFPAGTYAISEPIKTYPSDDNATDLIFDHQAIITPIAVMNYLVDLGGYSETFDRHGAIRKKYLRGGVFKANNGNCTVAAININKLLEDVDVSDCVIHTLNCDGIQIGDPLGSNSSSDAFIHHIMIKHDGASNTQRGIAVYSSDNNISDARIYWNQIGVALFGGSTYLDNVHTLANAQTNNISFQINGTDAYLTNCYGDSENTFVQLNKPGTVIPKVSLNNCQYFTYKQNKVTYFDIADIASIKINGLNIQNKTGNTHIGIKCPYSSFGKQMNTQMLDVSGLDIINAKDIRDGDPLKGMQSADNQPVFLSTSLTANTWYYVGSFAVDNTGSQFFTLIANGRMTKIPLNISCSSAGALSGSASSGAVETDDTGTYSIGFKLNNSGFDDDDDYPLISVYVKRSGGDSRTLERFKMESKLLTPISTNTTDVSTAISSSSDTPTVVFSIDCENKTVQVS